MSTSEACSAHRRRATVAGLLLAALLAAASGLSASRAQAGQSGDYATIFGERYAAAGRFLHENDWIARALKLPPDEARLALAVVFPELIRFSALEDDIQVRGLKVLYVQYGRAHANFSVGRFQMKPSFAEQVEADCARLFGRRERDALDIPAFRRGDTPALRDQRVRRLDDMEWQVRYLRLFMLVMGKRYPAVARGGAEDRLRFYATAYNSGYAAGVATIRRRVGRRHFHTARLLPADTYDYADVAVAFFRRHRPR